MVCVVVRINFIEDSPSGQFECLRCDGQSFAFLEDESVAIDAFEGAAFDFLDRSRNDEAVFAVIIVYLRILERIFADGLNAFQIEVADIRISEEVVLDFLHVAEREFLDNRFGEGIDGFFGIVPVEGVKHGILEAGLVKSEIRAQFRRIGHGHSRERIFGHILDRIVEIEIAR